MTKQGEKHKMRLNKKIKLMSQKYQFEFNHLQINLLNRRHIYIIYRFWSRVLFSVIIKIWINRVSSLPCLMVSSNILGRDIINERSGRHNLKCLRKFDTLDKLSLNLLLLLLHAHTVPIQCSLICVKAIGGTYVLLEK